MRYAKSPLAATAVALALVSFLSFMSPNANAQEPAQSTDVESSLEFSDASDGMSPEAPEVQEESTDTAADAESSDAASEQRWWVGARILMEASDEASARMDKSVLGRLRRLEHEISSTDSIVMARYWPGEPHSDKETTAFLDAVNRSSKTIEAMRGVVASGQIREYLARCSQMEAVAAESTLRYAARLFIRAAVAANYYGDSGGRVANFTALFQLPDEMERAPDPLIQTCRTGIRSQAFFAFNCIYSGKAVSNEEAYALIGLIENPSGERMNAYNVEGQLPMIEGALSDPAWMRDAGYYAQSTATQFLKEEKEPAIVKARAEGERIADLWKNGKIAEVCEIQQHDLRAFALLKSQALAAYAAPFYALRGDELWDGVMNRTEVTWQFPVAFHAQEELRDAIEFINNDLAHADLSLMLLMIRTCEADTGRLPASIGDIFATAERHDLPLERHGDPYSGQPYRYAVKNGPSGEPTGFVLYSVGPDLKDDGGQLKLPEGGMNAGSFDIGIEGKTLTGAATK